MKRTSSVVIVLFSVLLLFSCRSSKQSMGDKKEMGEGMKSIPEVAPGVPPNHCRLVATVVSIDETMAGTGDDPCSKAPCVAEIRVDEILGYGSAFGGPLATGKNIKVKFTYTTHPTKDLFPAMTPALPGLSVGNRFQADLRAQGPSMGNADSFRYQVDRYSIK